jgi:hypothetical protein
VAGQGSHLLRRRRGDKQVPAIAFPLLLVTKIGLGIRSRRQNIPLHSVYFRTYGPGAESQSSMDYDTASTKELDRLFDARISRPLSGESWVVSDLISFSDNQGGKLAFIHLFGHRICLAEDRRRRHSCTEGRPSSTFSQGASSSSSNPATRSDVEYWSVGVLRPTQVLDAS